MPPSSIPAKLALIHGWGFNPSVWEALVRPLSQLCEVQSLALPGYAPESPECSVLPDSAGFEETARHLARNVPEGALLCAWSLGALIALQAALAFPSRFSGLVLIGTSPCFFKGLEWLRETDLREKIASIEIPVLLIHGEKAPLMPLEAARWMQKRFPDARLEILPGAAHAPFLRHPEAVARRIGDEAHAFQLRQTARPRVL
jgi:pimeloyl-ACP methyl ester carboxylesterase